jgi:FtsP/CotA-like multicopper oxidase with cupredoxin domain
MATPPAMDAPLIEPETRRSVNGVLQTTLRCTYAYRDIGGVRLYTRSYEGGSPGPTLRMKPGETLKIRMPNDFPPTAT